MSSIRQQGHAVGVACVNESAVPTAWFPDKLPPGPGESPSPGAADILADYLENFRRHPPSVLHVTIGESDVAALTMTVSRQVALRLEEFPISMRSGASRGQ